MLSVAHFSVLHVFPWKAAAPVIVFGAQLVSYTSEQDVVATGNPLTKRLVGFVEQELVRNNLDNDGEEARPRPHDRFGIAGDKNPKN